MRNRSRGDGENRGDISVDYGRHGYRSKYNILSYYSNTEEKIDDDWRGGYRYQTSHSSSNNPGKHVILLNISVNYRRVKNSLHRKVRIDNRGDDGRLENRSQEINQYYFKNDRESVDGDGEVDICLRPAPLPSTVQEILIYCWVFIFMVTR